MNPRQARPRFHRPGPRRKCVLIVEDNASIGGLIAGLLREDGYRALRAWDGREALRLARDRRPDLILLDLDLPHKDGVEVLYELKQHKETRTAPIIVVSGNTIVLSDEDRELLADMISKPFDIDVLLNAVRQALGDPVQEVMPKDYDLTDSHLHSW
ncbi:MAG: response regulator [Chloroflexota bacterium]